MGKVAAFRAAVGAWGAKQDAIARTNDAIGSGADVATIDALMAHDDAISRADQALDTLFASFGVKPATYGGQRHTDARLRIRAAVDRTSTQLREVE